MIDLTLWRRHRWVRDTRYYEAYIHQDLWGNWLLTRVWGRIGTAMGQHKHEPMADLEQALAQLDSVARRRKQRGYVRAGEPADVHAIVGT